MQPPRHFEELLGYLASDARKRRAYALAQAVALRAALGLGREYRPDLASNALGDHGVSAHHFGRVEAAIGAAKQVREYAYAPYSAFRVGAAVLGADGSIAVGTNVECSSYGLTLCAERAALAAARAEGIASILLVCIVADTAEPISPCGACRQWIIELAPRALVAMISLNGKERWCTVETLLPFAFDSRMFHTEH